MLAYKQNKSYGTILSPSTGVNAYNYYIAIKDMTTTAQKADLIYSFIGSHINASIDATMGKINIDKDFKSNYHSGYEPTTETKEFLGLSASAVGTFGRFGISTDASLYKTYKDFSDHYDYKFLDIRLSPVYNFPLGIKASATVTYTYYESNIDYYEYDKKNWWCTLRVAKQWNNLEAYMKWENNFNGEVQVNETANKWDNLSVHTYSYEKHLNQVTFGLSYRF
jgi:hypothetical protein